MEIDQHTIALSEEELALWQKEIAQVKPLAQGGPISSPQMAPTKTQTKGASRPPIYSPLIKTPRHAPVLHSGDYHGVDKATVKRIKRGQLAIDGTIDLHGMNQIQAPEHLAAQIVESILPRKRLLLVITGKGRSHESVLRQRLPNWLNDARIRPYLLAFEQARPQDGGSGAFYVLLKRVKVLADETDFGD